MNDFKQRLIDFFKEAYAVHPLIVKSPGRVNIIGEHTDYNYGFVLPAAIDLAVYLAVSLREDDEIHLHALDLGFSFQTAVQAIEPVKEGWPNYILGVVAQFKQKGIKVRGFNAVITSNVPVGAGLSSSAAVECATAFALNELFFAGFSKLELIKMAQMAEHEFAGVKCGIMDQFASMLGKKNHVLQLDCRSLEFNYVPFQLPGIKIVLLNTNVKHSLATSAYNTRRNECEQAVNWIKEAVPQIESLRDADEEMLAIHVLPRSHVIYERALFVVQEIARLQKACVDLVKGDIAALGKKMFATHDGLSKMYDVSCPELDFLVDFVRDKEYVLGARMMGGGFGGCTINLVKEDKIDELLTTICPAYEEKTGLSLSGYIASVEDGTGLV